MQWLSVAPRFNEAVIGPTHSKNPRLAWIEVQLRTKWVLHAVAPMHCSVAFDSMGASGGCQLYLGNSISEVNQDLIRYAPE